MLDTIKILLVEDDAADARGFERLLDEIEGQCSFEYCSSVDLSLIALKENQYDIVFLNYHLLVGNSFILLDYIKSESLNIPTVIITPSSAPQIAVELIQKGATDYIPKSLLTPDGLSQSIRGAIRLKELQAKKNKIENRLKSIENRLETIISNTPIILFVLDSKGLIQIGLGKYWESFNPHDTGLIGIDFSKAYSDFEALIFAYNASLEGNLKECQVEINDVIFEVTFTPRLNDKNELIEVLGLALDITNHEKGKAALLKATKIAEKTSQMKQDFIANMSHEIRTPMNAIIGFADLLSETSLTGIQTDFVDSIKTSGDNLVSLVNDILDFSKIEAGKLRIEKEEFELEKVVKSVVNILEVKSAERQNKINYLFSEKIPQTLIGDGARLYQILVNLIGNGIKFTQGGNINIEVGIKTEKVSRLEVYFKIKDSGIGIPADKLKDIFDSFVQVESGGNRRNGGTGLGLAIVKRLIHLMGGEINVTSEEGIGSVFEFILPFDISFKKNIDIRDVEKKTSKSIKGKRILLAEDNEMNQKLVLMYLTKYDVIIDLAENGYQAIKAAKSNEYDLILMDIQMPEVDGLEASTEIRKIEGIKGLVPIIAMTAHAFKEEIENCFNAGMNAHISKPINKEAFLTLISSLVHPHDFTAQNDNNILAINETEALVDISYLRDMFDGNEGFINEMIRIFKADSPVLIQTMKDAFDEKDWGKLSKVSHKYRSSAVMMGMKDVAKIAEKVEYNDFTKGNQSVIKECIDLIDEQSSLAINYIKNNF